MRNLVAQLGETWGIVQSELRRFLENGNTNRGMTPAR